MGYVSVKYFEKIIIVLVLFQTTPPLYSDDAEQCVVAGDSFFADTTCLDYYRTLGLRSSATEVDNAANAICANETCMNRMGSYINYLITCQLGSIEDDNDEDNDNNDVCCKYFTSTCDFSSQQHIQ